MQAQVVAAPAAALGYEPKYPPGFEHFDYVDPTAPQGGELILSGFGNYDSFNPFILKSVSVDGLGTLVLEPLMVQSADEPYSLYAHLAEDIDLAEDGLSVTFRLDPRAHFSNGDPVLAEDVKFSFDTLKSDKAHPQFGFYWADIQRAEVLDERTLRFDFAKRNPELHLIVAQMQVFARKWVEGTAFDKLTRTPPIGSGPYTIEKYRLGKDITYVRDPNYWAKDLNTRRGMFNFDRVTYKYYSDETVHLEALKAGEFDFMLVNNSKQWARDYVGPQFTDGRIVKEELAHRNNAGMQGFVMNTRRDKFKDRRVRRALSLAFDFDWSNKNLFYNQYTRCDSYFSNSELAATGLPEGDELALLEQFRDQLPAAIFTEEWKPADTSEPGALRRNLREAKALLEEAGWKVRDGRLRNAAGEPFNIEVLLAQKGFERILAPYGHNLRKLGIELDYRTVDVSLYVQRRRTFNFDMMVASFPQSQSPGNEQFNMWYSTTADQEGSNNMAGIKDPVVDALVNKLVYAPNRAELITAAHALDRVLLYGEYVVPNWYIATHRVAYWDKFAHPATLPLYYDAESWVLQSWWRKPAESTEQVR
ncbi:MAG: extracellular solute-binding protein [Gammaproteobacteria bacterium]|nr:extracellular solute-binding protein [Gammaproteobacteria bacterium]MBU2479177.1 extracellular solute-binding protein [Gammaproteobacteria bacterium]